MSLANYARDGTELPATAGAAATERAPAETTEASPAATASKSPATETASAAHHSADRGANPPTASPASTAPPASASDRVRNQGYEKDQQYYYEDRTGPVPLLLSAGRARHRNRRRRTEADAAILRDHIRNATRH